MASKTLRIIGVPMDLGQNKRGVDMGPSAIRYAEIASTLESLGHSVKDGGDLQISGHYSLKSTHFEDRLEPIREGCEKAYQAGKEAVDQGEIPVFLGGDHSASIGTVGGISHDSPAGLIWIDAHGDFNTPSTSKSCNVHGMALGVLLGRGSDELVNVGRPGAKVRPQHTVLMGVRDLDREEKIMLRESGITVFTMRDIDELGIHTVLVRTLEKLHQLDRIHVSLDMDSMDPLEAPGVGTPSNGGLTYREGQLIMETIADSGKLCSMDIMEINPILDISNKTAKMAVELAASLFGKSII